jgi:hypothetical protein
LKILESFIPIFVEKSKLMADEMGEHLEEPAFDAMKIVMKYTLEAVFGKFLYSILAQYIYINTFFFYRHNNGI